MLLAPRQLCSEDMTGDDASMLHDRRAAAPARLARCASAQPSAESHGSSSGSVRRQQRRRRRFHEGARTGKVRIECTIPPLSDVARAHLVDLRW